jgi:ParB/RepB/Spo0J family partition protein
MAKGEKNKSEPDALRAIALADIKLSTTGGQAERRKHFDQAAIGELADSIKTVGLLAPLVARPVNGHFELVAGERRYLAAQQAGLKAVHVTVRELTDEQVLEIQLIENLQREGLHELAEAEGYEALQRLGHSAAEIADKVGKSKAYVYARMKLLALSKPGRTAFYEGKLSASTALLLARIPVEALQKEALAAVIKPRWNGEGMSYREAADLIQRDYMMRLSSAGFPTEDAELVAPAGACGACPKRTGNQAELFGDIKHADVCTDLFCFKGKREAFAAREIKKAEQLGRTVITGKDAKKILPYGAESSVQGGYVKLTEKNWDDPKKRTNAQLLGKDFEPVLVKDADTGVLVKVAPQSAVNAALKDAGVKSSSSSGGSNPQSAAEKKAKLEKKFRAALYSEMRDKFPAELGQGDLKTIALRFYHEMQQDTQKQILGLWQWEPIKRKGGYGLDWHKPAADGIAGFDDAQIARFFFDLVFIKDLQVHTWSDEKPTLLLTTAKKLKVDPEKIRRQLNAASIPKAKKKAKRK